ncbi:pilus assembly protein [Kitasatospora sp. NBC_01287]|uniref:TadE/TadG family type IV pilus assembly protein n=1 Tax=Kitasatospora sp. NBC_01287 TaxID=2903573 RepID=UPI00225970AD|nr:TadE/TadG family type IV pilus assembly protein [Kitasatospora sp. NBC_01287]MCX4750575.1 pilus assembly protein [Kitasatospora sp. NBC_01287]
MPRIRRTRIRRPSAAERDRGSASTELAIVAPLLLLLLLAIVQFALAVHAHHIAQAAASRALATARAEHATAEAGRADGQALLRAVDSGSLRGPSVAVTRTGTRASVEVSGTVVKLIPFLDLHVTARAAGPVEHLTGPDR